MDIPQHQERIDILASIRGQVSAMGENISRLGASRLRPLLRAIDEGLQGQLNEEQSELLYVEVIERLLMLAMPISRERVEGAIEGLNSCLAEGQPRIGSVAIDRGRPHESEDWTQWPRSSQGSNAPNVDLDQTASHRDSLADLARLVPSHQKFTLSEDEREAVEFFHNQLLSGN